MGGVKSKRLNNEPVPGLQGTGKNLLDSIFGAYGGTNGGQGFGTGANAMQRFGGMGAKGQNPLGNPGGGDLLSRLQQVIGGPDWQHFGGQEVLSAAQPVFQQNLSDALGLQREGGARFSSGQNLLAQQTSDRALNDFNLFSKNVLQQGQQTQLQALAAQQNMLLPLLQALFQGGGFNTDPAYQQSGGGLGRLLGGIGGTALGSFLGPLGAAAGGKAGSSLFGSSSPAEPGPGPWSVG